MLIGGHIDSVPNGGWLDGCLNVVAGAEVLRRIAEQGTPPVTVRLVDWADEEGARFGRSLFGSSAAAGSMPDQDELRAAASTGTGSPCPTRSPRTASTSTARSTPERQLESAAAYLELHIEQGPVLESLDIPLGVVLGTFGVERWRITWTGQAAHAGSTPMDKRRDALAGAAKLALEIREIAARVGERRRLHVGRRRVQAGHRHLGRRDGRAAARPAAPRRSEPGGRCCDGRRRRASGSPTRRRSTSPGSGSGRSSRSSSTRPLIGFCDDAMPRGRRRLAPAAVRAAARRRRGLAGRRADRDAVRAEPARALAHEARGHAATSTSSSSVAALDRLADQTIAPCRGELARRRRNVPRGTHSMTIRQHRVRVADTSLSNERRSPHGTELRRHRPARPARQPARRADAAR